MPGIVLNPPTPTRSARNPREQFEVAAREHAKMLSAFLHGLTGRPDLVDELLQETLVTAWRRWETFDATRPFGPWVRGIASKIVLRYRDRASRDRLRCDQSTIDRLEARFSSLENSSGFAGVLDRLETCMKALSHRVREVIELAYREDMPLAEIAQQIGSSEEAVKKRVQRGRRALADCLKQGEDA